MANSAHDEPVQASAGAEARFVGAHDRGKEGTELRTSTRVAGFPAPSSMVLAVDQTKPFFLNGPRLIHE